MEAGIQRVSLTHWILSAQARNLPMVSGLWKTLALSLGEDFFLRRTLIWNTCWAPSTT